MGRVWDSESLRGRARGGQPEKEEAESKGPGEGRRRERAGGWWAGGGMSSREPNERHLGTEAMASGLPGLGEGWGVGRRIEDNIH